jgi:hypothetical protein
VVVKALEEPAPGHDTYWSSQTAISRIWRAFGLKPHLEQTWKLSADPRFIDKVRDIVGLYLDPPAHAIVVFVDEKSQIQALERTQPMRWVGPTGLSSTPRTICGTTPRPCSPRWRSRPGTARDLRQLGHSRAP